jgi:hypothetical protein
MAVQCFRYTPKLCMHRDICKENMPDKYCFNCLSSPSLSISRLLSLLSDRSEGIHLHEAHHHSNPLNLAFHLYLLRSDAMLICIPYHQTSKPADLHLPSAKTRTKSQDAEDINPNAKSPKMKDAYDRSSDLSSNCSIPKNPSRFISAILLPSSHPKAAP